MDEVMNAIAAGDYLKAYDALTRTQEAQTQVGVAVGGFLLSLSHHFDDADRLLASMNLQGLQVAARGERLRLARWTDAQAAGSLAASEPLPFVGMYAGMAVALVTHNADLVARVKHDMQQIRPVRGRIYINGQPRPFNDLVDADDSIGQMLETFCGNGLLYFPFAALRRVDFLPKTNFMDHLMPKVQITEASGNQSMGFVPLLYAGSSMDPDPTIRTGRMTTFEYVGQGGRRAKGQRDFFADGSVMIGLQGVTAIEFG